MIKRLHKTIKLLNTNKYFIGLMMILMNITSKYVTVKLSDSQEAYIKNYIAREILIFSACWMGTRDILTSIFLTAGFFVLTQHLFHENSKYCVLPKHHREYHKKHVSDVTQHDISHAIDVLKRAKKQNDYVERENIHKEFSI